MHFRWCGVRAEAGQKMVWQPPSMLSYAVLQIAASILAFLYIWSSTAAFAAAPGTKAIGLMAWRGEQVVAGVLAHAAFTRCCRETSAMFAGAGMMAADGRCKTLDAAADGYVRGEAVVLIKLWYASVPLSHIKSFSLQVVRLHHACLRSYGLSSIPA